MARIKALRDYINGETWYLDSVSGMGFGRLSFGAAWPSGELAGTIAILGESRSAPAEYGLARHDVHKLLELQEMEAAALVERMRFISSEWPNASWAVPLYDRRACLIEDANMGLRAKRKPRIACNDPQGFSGKGEGLLPFYHALVQRRTMSEKTLFLGEGESADQIARLGFADAGASVCEFPAAAALCFALADIDLGHGQKRALDPEALGPACDLGGY